MLREYLDILYTAYLDDIIIFSDTLQEYIKYIRLVLKQLRKFHLYVKREKYVFYKAEVEFLGFRLGRNGVSPNLGKLETIRA